MGVDLGSARIGVAISDSHQRVASALLTVTRTGDGAADRRALALLVDEEEAVGVVVGLPLSLDGSVGPAARAALDEVARLAEVAGGVAVETVDERFTTVTAHQALRAGDGRSVGPGLGGPRDRIGGRRTGGAARRGAQARQRVDSLAATILLQSWLDRRHALGSMAQ